MENKIIKINEIELSVEGYYNGSHYEATEFTPVEKPEFIVSKITLVDFDSDIQDLLDMNEVYNLLNLEI